MSTVRRRAASAYILWEFRLFFLPLFFFTGNRAAAGQVCWIRAFIEGDRQHKPGSGSLISCCCWGPVRHERDEGVWFVCGGICIRRDVCGCRLSS